MSEFAPDPRLTFETLATYGYALAAHLLPTFGPVAARPARRDSGRALRRSHGDGGIPARGRGSQRRRSHRYNRLLGRDDQGRARTAEPNDRVRKRHLGFAGENPVATLSWTHVPGTSSAARRSRASAATNSIG
jgi:hypothetical protein